MFRRLNDTLLQVGTLHLQRKNSGFTIVELLIVVVVIAILATITIVSYQGISSRAKDSQVKSAAAQIVREIKLYETTASPDPYPTTTNVIQTCNKGTITCDYLRTDYTSFETGELIRGFQLTACGSDGSVQYLINNSSNAPQAITPLPRINNQYLLFTSPSMGVVTSGAPGTEYGQIYAYTGQTVNFDVPLGSCTIGARFQWQQRIGSGSWTDIGGATSKQYTTPTLNSSYDGRSYRVVVTNANGSTTTKHGIVIMDFEP